MWGDGSAIANPGHWAQKDLDYNLLSSQACMQIGWPENTDHWDDVGCNANLRYACQVDF